MMADHRVYVCVFFLRREIRRSWTPSNRLGYAGTLSTKRGSRSGGLGEQETEDGGKGGNKRERGQRHTTDTATKNEVKDRSMDESTINWRKDH